MKSIRINILGRDYALRVHEEDEDQTRRLADFVEDRMRRFQKAHPEQAELTTAIITALALAEEVHDLREDRSNTHDALNDDLNALADRLAAALPETPSDGAETGEPVPTKHDGT
jgi:cell division protein ZapA